MRPRPDERSCAAPLLAVFSARYRYPRSRCCDSHPVTSESLGATRACSSPAAAATAAAAPHARTNQNTFWALAARSNINAGMSATAQIRSLRNACPPRPSAKNENRQLSCSRSAGSVSPSARKADLAAPLSTVVTASTQAPVTTPTTPAVPVQLPTARRHVWRSTPLNLTSSGSEARPRDAFRAN